jgi:hypothetical protein
MGELWWAEAVIAIDRSPDWTAAHELIDELTAQEICDRCPEYLNDVAEQVLASAGIAGPAAGFVDEDVLRTSKLVSLVRALAHVDLNEVAVVLAAGRPHVCAFESAGLRIFVHDSGYSSGGPDHLCDIWLRLQNVAHSSAPTFANRCN